MGQYSLGEALNAFLNKSHLKSRIQALQINDVWEEIMGKTIAKHTDDLQIIGQKLIIHTQVAPLKNELIYQREKIIQRINEIMGKQVINEIIVK